MHGIEALEQIEARAAAINLSLYALIRISGADHSLFSRWRRGLCSPTFRVLSREIAKLDTALDRLEAEIFWGLAARWGVADRIEAALFTAPPANGQAEAHP